MSESISLTAGQTMSSSPIKLSEDEIITFAQQFDPQPYHLDRNAAAQSIFGGLCASGWQVAALINRLVIETLQQAGVPVVDVDRVANMRWKRPLFVDESISVVVTIDALGDHPTQTNYSSLALDVSVNNAQQQQVAEMQCQVAIDRERTS